MPELKFFLSVGEEAIYFTTEDLGTLKHVFDKDVQFVPLYNNGKLLYLINKDHVKSITVRE